MAFRPFARLWRLLSGAALRPAVDRGAAPDHAVLVEAVQWAYRLLLGREPESRSVIEQHARVEPRTTEAIRVRFMRSAEFAMTLRQLQMSLTREYVAPEFLLPFVDLSDAAAEPGFFRDVFGIRTCCAQLPEALMGFSGKIGRLDQDPVLPMHDVAELEGFLRGVAEARDVLTVVELGAGWGPWIVLGTTLGRRRGLHTRLVAVEGDAEHIYFMQQHMGINGINPADHRILHAVIGARDGAAQFPLLASARDDWGAEARFDDDPITSEMEMARVPCLSIATVLDGIDHVDVLHCDIQGAEADAIRASIDVLTARVRRLIIGTHRRGIEEQLHALLFAHGWRVEADQACRIADVGDRMLLVQDGCQIWRNDSIRARRVQASPHDAAN
jgi:FkbM family methyltransferase